MAKKSVGMLVAVMMIAALALGVSTPRAQAQGDGPQRTITVTGFGTSYGVPDIVMIGLGVETTNPDVKMALDASSARMNAVLQALKDNGIDPKDIRTENFSIYQDYYGYGPMEMGQEGQPNYRVSTSVVLTVRDAARVGDVLAAAVNAGANIVNYIQFDIEDRTALLDEARSLAVQDARARAEHLAALLGMAVGEPVTVTENGDFYGGVPFRGGGAGGAGADMVPPISQGQLSINMSVTITYVLVPAN